MFPLLSGVRDDGVKDDVVMIYLKRSFSKVRGLETFDVMIGSLFLMFLGTNRFHLRGFRISYGGSGINADSVLFFE